MEPLRDGRLNLSTIVEVANVITPENAADVLPRFFGTSKREAREVVAELQPDPAPRIRTVVTALRAPEPALELAATSLAVASRGVIPQVAGVATRAGAREESGEFTRGAVLPEEPPACQLSVPDVASPPSVRAERSDVEPLTAELTRLHVTVPRRLLQKLAAARDALSHSHPGATDDVVLELGLDLIIERYRKRRGIGAKPRGAARATAASAADAAAATASPASTGGPPRALRPPPPPPERSRHVPAAVWRAVWERDQGRCVWPLEGGGVCGSTRRLQLDHVEGWALGGATTIDACRLLCRGHNLQHARQLYGDAVMNRYVTPTRGGHAGQAVAE